MTAAITLHDLLYLLVVLAIIALIVFLAKRL